MKNSQINLPVILLNEGNIDFIFDIFDNQDYQVGLGVTPGIPNTDMREIVRKDIQDDKFTAIHFMEIDPERKRYIPLTKWFQDDMKSFINENINYPYSEPINYWGSKYDVITGNLIKDE